jgi:hypothetical protein
VKREAQPAVPAPVSVIAQEKEEAAITIDDFARIRLVVGSNRSV